LFWVVLGKGRGAIPSSGAWEARRKKKEESLEAFRRPYCRGKEGKGGRKTPLPSGALKTDEGTGESPICSRIALRGKKTTLRMRKIYR